jgi:hypothetical protein
MYTYMQASTLPPMEFLSALSCLYGAVDKLKSHFEDIFARPLKDSPNILSLCRESKRLALKRLEVVARESMHAWITCVNVHIGKMLSNIQSKYDYSPKESPKGEVLASPACDNACKALLTVANTVRVYQDSLAVTGMNLIETFWQPFGSQFIGILISHYKKLKITQDGSLKLFKDLDEYCYILAVFEAPETIDMIICMKEILNIMSVPPEAVIQYMTQNLRHLDPTIILALIKSRADYTKVRVIRYIYIYICMRIRSLKITKMSNIQYLLDLLCFEYFGDFKWLYPS